MDTGALVGSRDYLCNPIPQSEGSAVLNVGPGYFLCADPKDRDCDHCGDADDTSCAFDPATVPECRRPCSKDADCVGGEFCADGNDVNSACSKSGCFCANPGQGSKKFVTLHELGHMLQDAFAPGVTTGGYSFQCPPGQGECDSFGKTEKLYGNNVLIDPPLMNPLCGCSHVERASGLHCLQSIEITPAAQGEGFGQYLASKLWNRRDAPCVFNYYKEFLDTECKVEDATECTDAPDGSKVTPPPVPVACDVPAKWRNKNECVVRPEDGDKTEMGTEYDWMTFLYALDGEVKFADVMNLFNYACIPYDPVLEPDHPAPSTGDACTVPVYWFDRQDANDVYVRGGFADGAERKYGVDSPGVRTVERLGREHGVSDSLE